MEMQRHGTDFCLLIADEKTQPLSYQMLMQQSGTTA
jgi:hypothetical protein